MKKMLIALLFLIPTAASAFEKPDVGGVTCRDVKDFVMLEEGVDIWKRNLNTPPNSLSMGDGLVVSTLRMYMEEGGLDTVPITWTNLMRKMPDYMKNQAFIDKVGGYDGIRRMLDIKYQLCVQEAAQRQVIRARLKDPTVNGVPYKE